MDRDQIEAIRKQAVRNFKMESIGCGWFAAAAVYQLFGIIAGQAAFFNVFCFALFAALAGLFYRQAFGEKGRERVKVRLFDEKGKEIT